MLKIEQIKLLRGSHPDTGTTGQGCVMNVIAYLNGEPQITDQSPCVCFVVRPILIWLNDALLDTERHRLIPYIEPAMGSRSNDPAVFVPRAQAVARFAAICAKWAASAKWAEWTASVEWAKWAKSAAKWAEWAAKWAGSAESAAMSARAAAESVTRVAERLGVRADVIKAAFAFLDEALPAAPETQPAVVLARAQKLLELA
jgi:hypothetical protein